MAVHLSEQGRHALLGRLPPLLLLHGTADGVVPPSSTADLLAALQELRDGVVAPRGTSSGGHNRRKHEGLGGPVSDSATASVGIEGAVPPRMRIDRHGASQAFMQGKRFDGFVGPVGVTAVPLAGVDHTEPVLALMGHDPRLGPARLPVPADGTVATGRDAASGARPGPTRGDGLAHLLLRELHVFMGSTLRKRHAHL